nr:MAG TPA: hypothetical protein [Caudoviricetes sp.]
MRELRLSVTPKVFAGVLSGERDTIEREIRPQNSHRYIEYFDGSGRVYRTFADVPDDVEIDARPLEYESLRLTEGRGDGARSLLVRVVSAGTYIVLDEDGYANIYTFQGKEYVTARIVYGLGEIIESNV